MVKIVKITDAKSIQIEYANRSYWIRQSSLEEDLINLLREAEYNGRVKLQKDLKFLLNLPA